MRKVIALTFSVMLCGLLCACAESTDTGTVTSSQLQGTIVSNSVVSLVPPLDMPQSSSAAESAEMQPEQYEEHTVTSEAVSSETIVSSEKPAQSEKPVSSEQSTASKTPVSSTQPPVSSEQAEDQMVTKQMLDQIQAGFLRLVNAERANYGASALTLNGHLEQAAQQRSVEIMDKYSHTRPDGSRFYTLVNVNKYNYRYLGENIGQACHSGKTYRAGDAFIGSDEQIEAIYTYMFEAFKDSAPHYATMINGKYAHTGIGISYRIDEQTGVPIFYFAHLFGNK